MKLKSGEDTNIIGSQVKGDKVVAEIGGNLNVISKQDTDNYTANNESSSFGASTGQVDGKSLPPGTGPINKVATGGVSGSCSAGKTDWNYASVTDQAGIFAGKGGFDITVGKNTDLKGAVIASDATPDKNKISTGTLTYSDIQNKADYSSSSVGVNYDSRTYSKYDPNYKNQGLTPNIGVTASGSADSTTKSAVLAGATITITGKQTQDLSGLSRDTGNSLNVLGKIFDKKTVQEQQELAKVFGEEAFKAIGDLGLKEGSSEKVALDAFAGGLMAKLGGGNFASGAAGAGFNQLVMNELANIKDPAALQWASALVGAVAAKVVGGNAQTGASTAASETKNNYLTAHQILVNAITGLVLVQVAGEQFIKDKTGKVVATWSSDEEGFVDCYGNYLGNKWDSVVLWAKGDKPDEKPPVAPPSENWGRPDTLQDHYERHGDDFGAKDANEYAEKANDFFKTKDNYEVKVDEKGVTRVYDPKTNTFGSYNPDGSTKTFYKPSGGSKYWEDQPGN